MMRLCHCGGPFISVNTIELCVGCDAPALSAARAPARDRRPADSRPSADPNARARDSLLFDLDETIRRYGDTRDLFGEMRLEKGRLTIKVLDQFKEAALVEDPHKHVLMWSIRQVLGPVRVFIERNDEKPAFQLG